jgi:hypothetical protein
LIVSADERAAIGEMTGNDGASMAELRAGESVAVAMRLVGPPESGPAPCVE